MKKNLLLSVTAVTLFLFASCGAGTDSPEGAAKKWCELNGKVHNAASDEEKDKARDEREKFEDEIESKHKDDKEWMKKLEEEVEKCEDASEGR